MSQTSTDREKSYLWCDTCRRSFSHADMEDGLCPVCRSETRSMGKFSAIIRGLMSNELSPSPLFSRHRQMIRMIWTRNGMGEQYYRVLAPDVSYSTFEKRVTDLLSRGAEEGWVKFVFPLSPQADEHAYRLEFVDEDRFIEELHRLFPNQESEPSAS